jgi:DNA helicase IV
VLSRKGQVDAVTQTVATFLRHFKRSGVTLEDWRKRAADRADAPRVLAFPEIFESVLEAYQGGSKARSISNI